jgi:hypothetical protein
MSRASTLCSRVSEACRPPRPGQHQRNFRQREAGQGAELKSGDAIRFVGDRPICPRLPRPGPPARLRSATCRRRYLKAHDLGPHAGDPAESDLAARVGAYPTATRSPCWPSGSWCAGGCRPRRSSSRLGRRGGGRLRGVTGARRPRIGPCCAVPLKHGGSVRIARRREGVGRQGRRCPGCCWSAATLMPEAGSPPPGGRSAPGPRSPVDET